MWNEKSPGENIMSHLWQFQKPVCIGRRQCCVSGGFRRLLRFYEVIQKVLFQIKQNNGSNWWKSPGISQSEGYCFLQANARLQISLETLWMGSPTTTPLPLYLRVTYLNGKETLILYKSVKAIWLVHYLEKWNVLRG